MPLTIALVGRPNVGKSTLFNRLTGRRHALVDDQPGVTRDRRYGEGNIGPLEITVIDTAGLEEAAKETMQSRMRKQTESAIDEADVALLMVDGRAGITQDDKHFAALIRKRGRPVVLAINKAEGGYVAPMLADAFALGLGEPVAISAEHGDGMVELHDALAKFEKEEEAIAGPEWYEEPAEEETVPFDEEAEIPASALPSLQIAIVGRPNAGKSTLLNSLIGKERVLTGPEPGLTRDAISVDYTFEGRKLRLIDTAGLRKKANVSGKVERLSVADALRAVQFAHVVVLVLDAASPLDKQDNTIAALVEQEGRALVIALNKWDTVAQKEKQAWMNALFEKLEDVLPQVKGVPVVPISALKKHNLDKLLHAAFDIYVMWNKRIPTGELNRWLEGALERHTPPMVAGRRLKIRYMTQVKTRPPTFAIFCNKGSAMPGHYLRYLLNDLRDHFTMPGVPVRLHVRTGKNPYVKDGK